MQVIFEFPCDSSIPFEMKPRTSGVPRAQSSKRFQGEGSNWILIAGGALLSTLSFRLGYKLKQVLDEKQPQDPCNGLKGLQIVKHSQVVFLTWCPL